MSEPLLLNSICAAPHLLYQDFYATFDLVDSTLRQNLVTLAQPLIESLRPFTSLAQLEKLVEAVIGEFLTWNKYTMASPKSCPNLATKEAASQQVQESSECEPIVDLPGSYVTIVDATIPVLEIGLEEEEEEVMEGEKVQKLVPERAKENLYQEFTKGYTFWIITHASSSSRTP